MNAANISRRDFARRVAAGAVVPLSRKSFAAKPGWTREWDRAILMSAVSRGDAIFDAKESLVFHDIGPEYHYHTNLRSTRAHITRESLDYAMNLLETGESARKQRAQKVIDRMLALQETDPKSQWYGLWGYYMEEPAPKMSPADYNWADFNGSTLLMMNARHGHELPAPMRQRLREAIRHSAISVMRRNVSMSYTNIAVQGTFVTLAAADLLQDKDLSRYAHERLGRFCANIDETGSFAEYNSPTYANVTIVNLVRMKMLLREEGTLAIVNRLHERIWLHLAEHWHAPTEQLAGPMSRCYSTDIGKPLWLQKSLSGAIPFATLDEIQQGTIHEAGEVSYLEYNCPENLREKFLHVADGVEHRELFQFTGMPAEPVEGTTFLANSYTIGSANRGEFWVQRRPLLAYWGGSSRPARYLQMRFMKDDYDFSSALFYSAQSRNYVAYIVNFRSPGGDKHISLDPIQNGEFQAQRMRVRFDLAQLPANSRLLVDGRSAKLDQRYPFHARVALDLGGTFAALQFHKALFGDEEPSLILSREEEMLTLSLDLFDSSKPRIVSWAATKQAFAAGTIYMSTSESSLDEFDRHFASIPCECKEKDGTVDLTWKTPSKELRVLAGATVLTVDAQNRLAEFSIGGLPVPEVRLSNAKLQGVG